jgi:hypothetical protein
MRRSSASWPPAQLWEQALEGQEIRCRVAGESLGGFGVVYPVHPGPEFWVRRDDAERAQAIREGLQEARPH